MCWVKVVISFCGQYFSNCSPNDCTPSDSGKSFLMHSLTREPSSEFLEFVALEDIGIEFSLEGFNHSDAIVKYGLSSEFSCKGGRTPRRDLRTYSCTFLIQIPQ